MRFLSFILAFLFVAAVANAQYTGGTKTATASFDCKVIAPLTWNHPADVTLPDVVAGTIRTFTGQVITFQVTGEPAYEVDVTTSQIADPGNSGGVVLNGTWNGDGTANLDGSGNRTVTYTINNVDAQTNTAAHTAHGVQKWTIQVDAYYTKF